MADAVGGGLAIPVETGSEGAATPGGDPEPGSDAPSSGGLGKTLGSGTSPAGAEDVLAAIQARLARAAAGCYPRAAARLGLVGTSVVRFCVARGGEPSGAELIKSSGQALLDDAATGCVLRAAAPLPETTRCLVVPVEFSHR
jgi:TonB family protein